MPVSKECIELLRKLTHDYEGSGKKDQNYKCLYEKLNNLLNDVNKNPLGYKDQDVTGCLASTALIQGVNDPTFYRYCYEFQVSYHRLTHSLNSFHDINFKIQSGPVAHEKTEEEPLLPKAETSSTPLLLELQMAIRDRAERVRLNSRRMTPFFSPAENTTNEPPAEGNIFGAPQF